MSKVKQEARELGMSQSLLRACEVVKCFPGPKATHDLKEVAAMCALSTTTAHRILKTLVEGGLLERRQKNLYGRKDVGQRSARYRFGYAAQTNENSFSRLVTESIRSYAYTNNIELVVADNRYSTTSALRNAELFAREKVDLAIEFQTIESAAPRIVSTLRGANIPIIAMEIPHPGAFYYGANNYRAGVIGGKALAQACLSRWSGKVDQVLLLAQPVAGALPQARLDGTVAMLRELLPKFSTGLVRVVDGKGRFEASLNAVRRCLRFNSSERVLVSGVNDLSCLGALRAFSEAGLEENCIIVGQNAVIEARIELRQPGTPYVGTVGYFPEQYGELVITLALDILQDRKPPHSTFVRHQLITKENVDSLYPNDETMLKVHGDLLLANSR